MAGMMPAIMPRIVEKSDRRDGGARGQVEQHGPGLAAGLVGKRDDDRAEPKPDQPADEADEPGLRDQLAGRSAGACRRSPA